MLLALLLGAGASSAAPCLTMRAHAAAAKSEHLLRPVRQQERPESVGSLASDRFPLRVHYADEVLAPRAEVVLEVAEEAWELLVVHMGYPAPPPDHGEGGDGRLDLYVGLVAPAAAITVAGPPLNPDAERRVSYAYVHIDRAVPVDELPIYVHHELTHVVQFGVDRDVSLMFAEASAVAQERFALPERLSWAEDLEDFQSWPNAPIFTNGIDFRPFAGGDTFYEFGAALFLLYLEQEHGDDDGSLVRRLWTEGPTDWLDALAAQVPTPIEDLVLDFVTWRALVAAWAVPDDGLVGAEELPASARLFAKRLLPAVLDGRALSLGGSDLPFQLGCATFQAEALSEPLPLRVSARSLGGEDEAAPRPIGLAWLLGDPAEATARRGRHEHVGEDLTVEATLAPRELGLFAVCDLGPAAASDLPVATPVEVRVRRLDVDFPDAGPAPQDAGPPAADAGPAEEPHCSCQTASPGRGGGAVPSAASRPWATVGLFVLALLIFLVRARRLARRRALYREGGPRRPQEGR